LFPSVAAADQRRRTRRALARCDLLQRLWCKALRRRIFGGKLARDEADPTCRTLMNFSKAAILAAKSSSSVCAGSTVQAQLPGSRGYDGRTRAVRGAHHDHAPDPARYTPEFESAGTASLVRRADLGASTKRTSKPKVAGPIFTVPSTKRERRSTSCCAPNGRSPPPRPSSGGLSGAKASC
jgi:hypothetical protein